MLTLMHSNLLQSFRDEIFTGVMQLNKILELGWIFWERFFNMLAFVHYFCIICLVSYRKYIVCQSHMIIALFTTLFNVKLRMVIDINSAWISILCHIRFSIVELSVGQWCDVYVTGHLVNIQNVGCSYVLRHFG